ncbi:MAG: hypothetical protein PQJ58_15745 [Spirochaetales bacterium]|nr:hypothetical protein [Spirochaetales bacterium]
MQKNHPAANADQVQQKRPLRRNCRSKELSKNIPPRHIGFLGTPAPKKAFIILALFLLSFPAFGQSAYAQSAFFAEIGYTPALIDFIYTASSPSTHTLKRSLWGIDLTTEYYPSKRFGFGQEFQWRGIDQITIRSGSDSYTLDKREGQHYFLRFSPQFLYAPLRKAPHMLALGFGPSFSMGYYLSEEADDFKDFYTGLTLKIRYRYLLNDTFYLSAGWSLTADLVYFGNFNELVFQDFIQIQNSPVLGIGYHR